MKHLNNVLNNELYEQGEGLVDIYLWTVMRSDPFRQPVWHFEAHLLYTPTAKYDPYVWCLTIDFLVFLQPSALL